MLRARLGWTRRSAGDISSRGRAVYGGMKEHILSFPKPPVDLEDLKAQLDRFDTARAGTLDGGRKAFAELQAARKVLTHSLDHLGHYVEAVSKDDVATFTSSGFELAGGGRTTADECPVPRLRWVRQGNNSGELLVAWTPLYRKAGHYELRWGVQSPNGEPPKNWNIDRHMQGRRPVLIAGLTPATIYVFQVRAFGKKGEYTDWSNPASHMCT
jgi:fibronectin type III domain protein